MFNKVVVAVDGSPMAEEILPYAVGLARSLGVPVELLYVVDPTRLHAQDLDAEADRSGVYLEPAGERQERPAHGADGHTVYLEQTVEHEESWARAYLKALADRMAPEGPSISLTIRIGDPAATIVREAQDDGETLVAMATHGRTGITRLLLGSVTDQVLHQGGMPLLLFRPQPGHASSTGRPRTIIVPLEGSAFSEEALPVAVALARTLNARVLVAGVLALHVLAPVPAAPAIFIPTPSDEMQGYIDGRVEALSSQGVEAEGLVLRGDAASQILQLEATTPDSLVVIPTHARSGIARTALGSVAEDVVRRSENPVLVLRAAR
jgi:nucleotide-binding universal stress UspA family protein